MTEEKKEWKMVDFAIIAYNVGHEDDIGRFEKDHEGYWDFVTKEGYKYCATELIELGEKLRELNKEKDNE